MEFYANSKSELKTKIEAARELSEPHHEVTITALHVNRTPVPFRDEPEAWGPVEIENIRRRYAEAVDKWGEVDLNGVAQFRIELK